MDFKKTKKICKVFAVSVVLQVKAANISGRQYILVSAFICQL